MSNLAQTFSVTEQEQSNSTVATYSFEQFLDDSVRAWFGNRIAVRASGCWERTRDRNRDGYGHVRFNGRRCLAHRASWQIAYGPIPAGLCVLHRCDNPPCVRPTHLFLGTRADNVYDRVAKGRFRTREFAWRPGRLRQRPPQPVEHLYTAITTALQAVRT